MKQFVFGSIMKDSENMNSVEHLVFQVSPIWIAVVNRVIMGLQVKVVKPLSFKCGQAYRF
jgi:hypothetical protein